MITRILTLFLFSMLIVGCSAGAPPISEPAASEQDVSAAAGAVSEDSAETPAAAESITQTAASDVATESNADSDGDQHPGQRLVASFNEPSQTNGDVLVLYGQVLDVNGNPVPQSVVEIWQTDARGVYDHPGDPGTQDRDTSFQFYGTAAVDADGWYAFRTIAPGRYEPRPRHIHFKVKQGGNTLLTSQFYFSDDVAEVQGESMFEAVGDSGELLLLQLVQGDDKLLANGPIVVDTGVGSGELPLTPSQGEGPYYPLVTLSEYDNDLATLP